MDPIVTRLLSVPQFSSEGKVVTLLFPRLTVGGRARSWEPSHCSLAHVTLATATPPQAPIIHLFIQSLVHATGIHEQGCSADKGGMTFTV